MSLAGVSADGGLLLRANSSQTYQNEAGKSIKAQVFK
jgi:hypothetical protein